MTSRPTPKSNSSWIQPGRETMESANIVNSVAFITAANGGYDVKNTGPEPARCPAGLLGSEQHNPAQPASRPAGGRAGGQGAGGWPVRRGAVHAYPLCTTCVHLRGCPRVRQRSARGGMDGRARLRPDRANAERQRQGGARRDQEPGGSRPGHEPPLRPPDPATSAHALARRLSPRPDQTGPQSDGPPDDG